MPYVASRPDHYKDSEPVGNRQCVTLVKEATGAPPSSLWKKGAKVHGNLNIARGTAIATFNSKGVYPNLPHGNHAAIYLGQDGFGIIVMDQWSHAKIIRWNHRIYFKGGRAFDENDGDCYSVVE